LQFSFGEFFYLCGLEGLHLDFRADVLYFNSSGHDAQILNLEYVLIIYQGETSSSTFPLCTYH